MGIDGVPDRTRPCCGPGTRRAARNGAREQAAFEQAFAQEAPLREVTK